MAVSCYNFPVIYLVLCFKPQNMFFYCFRYHLHWFNIHCGNCLRWEIANWVRNQTQQTNLRQNALVISKRVLQGGFATWCLIMLERTGRIKTGGIVIWIITWSTLYRSIGCNLQACWKGTICYQKVNHVVEKVAKLWETFFKDAWAKSIMAGS